MNPPVEVPDSEEPEETSKEGLSPREIVDSKACCERRQDKVGILQHI